MGRVDFQPYSLARHQTTPLLHTTQKIKINSKKTHVDESVEILHIPSLDLETHSAHLDLLLGIEIDYGG